jgi:hypothetical protein
MVAACVDKQRQSPKVESHAGLKKLVILPIALSFSPPGHGKIQ